MTDPLTGVLNRRGWALALDREERRCRRHGLDAVVAVVDLDRLKEVNDTGGHAAGDERIVACAQAIASAIRAEDTVARLGGDEFAVLAVHVVSDADRALLDAGAAVCVRKGDVSRLVEAFEAVAPPSAA